MRASGTQAKAKSERIGGMKNDRERETETKRERGCGAKRERGTHSNNSAVDDLRM